jgi:hypothetical protein
VAIEDDDVSRSADVHRDELVRPAAPLFEALAARARAGGGPVVVCASHRLADLPGFAEAMRAVPDCEIVRLDPEAACLGALERLDEIPRGGPGHRLIRRLRFERAPRGA